MFSIIVPAYNASGTLERCVDSILSQSFADFELILVDDGSKDDTWNICKYYESCDPRVKALHKTNGGASSARNFGLQKATHPWVTFCDSDDYVRPYWLDSFAKADHSSQLLIQGITFIGDDNRTVVFENHISSPAVAAECIIKQGVFGYTMVKAFRNEIIQQQRLCFDEQFWLKEDELFVLSYLKSVDKVSFASGTDYIYEMHFGDPDKYVREKGKTFDLLLQEALLAKDLSFGGYCYGFFIRKLTVCLLQGYEAGEKSRLSKLKQYFEVVGNGWTRIDDLSRITAFAFRMPLPVCNMILSLKKYIKNG